MAIPRYIGADEVITQYRKLEIPYFSMWCKSSIVCQYNGDDIDEGAEMIKEEIERSVRRGFNMECFLKIHPEKQKNYTAKSDVHYNIVFIAAEENLSLMSGNNNFNYALAKSLEAVNSRLAAIEDNLEQEEEDAPEDEGITGNDNGMNGIISGINQIIDHPLVSRIIEKFLSMPTNQKTQQQRPAQMAGTGSLEDQQAALQRAVEILLQKGVTVENFVKLSQMTEKKLQSLITFL